MNVNFLLQILEAQRAYHKKALEALEQAIPKLNEALGKYLTCRSESSEEMSNIMQGLLQMIISFDFTECNPLKPVYGVPLEEHLRVTGRDIALVLEVCVITLIEGGLDEEVGSVWLSLILYCL